LTEEIKTVWKESTHQRLYLYYLRCLGNAK